GHDLAGANILKRGGDVIARELYMVGDEVGGSLRRAFVWHMGNIDASKLLEQFMLYMAGAAHTRRTPVERVGFGFGALQQLGDILDVSGGIGQDDVGHVGHIRYGGEILGWIE